MAERQRIIFHILKNQILLQQTQTKNKQCFIHYSGASIAIENGNLSMRDNLVMTSAYARPYAPMDWQGGAKQTLQGVGGGGRRI